MLPSYPTIHRSFLIPVNPKSIRPSVRPSIHPSFHSQLNHLIGLSMCQHLHPSTPSNPSIRPPCFTLFLPVWQAWNDLPRRKWNPSRIQLPRRRKWYASIFSRTRLCACGKEDKNDEERGLGEGLGKRGGKKRKKVEEKEEDWGSSQWLLPSAFSGSTGIWT